MGSQRWFGAIRRRIFTKASRKRLFWDRSTLLKLFEAWIHRDVRGLTGDDVDGEGLDWREDTGLEYTATDKDGKLSN